MVWLDKPPRYCSYLLRCWEEQGLARVWRFSLEDPHTGQRLGFASLELLVAFLQAELSDDGAIETADPPL